MTDMSCLSVPQYSVFPNIICASHMVEAQNNGTIYTLFKIKSHPDLHLKTGFGHGHPVASYFERGI